MSRDREIVRTQKIKEPEGHLNTPPKSSCSVVMGPQVECEVVRDRALDEMPF